MCFAPNHLMKNEAHKSFGFILNVWDQAIVT